VSGQPLEDQLVNRIEEILIAIRVRGDRHDSPQWWAVLGHHTGSKLPARSRGTRSRTGHTPVWTVLLA
jgi:hypothetical protein